MYVCVYALGSINQFSCLDLLDPPLDPVEALLVLKDEVDDKRGKCVCELNYCIQRKFIC